MFSDCETEIKTQGVSRRGIEIGDNCWIGSNVVILDGVRIGGVRYRGRHARLEGRSAAYRAHRQKGKKRSKPLSIGETISQ